MENFQNHFLLDPSIIFLNHGSFGATPKPVFEEYQRWQRELERQPVEFLDRRFVERMSVSRGILGEYLGARPEDLVYVINATVGVNIVARSLDLGPNDEVLSTDHEYGACDRVWRFLSQEQGFTYVKHGIPLPIASHNTFLERFLEAVTERTKVIFLSHISSPTAMIFPVEEVCRRARERGILTLVDGAHAPGQIPLNLAEVDADFYTGNLHKWLCAPKGAGFLHARLDVQELLKPLVVSWGYEAENPGPSQFIDHHQWWGTRDIAPFLTVPAAIDYQKEHDWEAVRAHCHDLTRDVEHQIRSLCGLPSLYTDNSNFVQMVAAPLPAKTDLQALREYLYEEHRIEVPVSKWNGRALLRVSVQGYNSQNDIDALLKALRIWYVDLV